MRFTRTPTYLLALVMLLAGTGAAGAQALPPVSTPPVGAPPANPGAGGSNGFVQNLPGYGLVTSGMGQLGGAAGLADIGKTISMLRQQALGQVQGCDYLQYIALAQNIGTDVPAFGGLTEWTKSHWVGIPVTDYLGRVVDFGATSAAKKSAESEKQALVYQLEQVCHAVTQADELQKIAMLVSLADSGTGHMLTQLFGETRLTLGSVPGSDTKRLLANWDALYGVTMGGPDGATDSLYKMVTSTLKETVEKTDEMLEGIPKYQARLTELQDQTYEYAILDPQTFKFSCRNGRDPTANPVMHKGQMVCGPAPKEVMERINQEATQIAAQAGFMNTALTARMTQVNAIRLYADNYAEARQRSGVAYRAGAR